MTHHTNQLFEEALKLPPEARAALAGTLIESLEEPVDERAEEAWAAEIQRRLDELDNGSGIDRGTRRCDPKSVASALQRLR